MITTFERRKLRAAPEGSVLSIGVFDGVHLGHRAILESNVALAGDLGAVPTVLTFRRHPKRLLLGNAPKTLTTLEHRLELFARAYFPFHGLSVDDFFTYAPTLTFIESTIYQLDDALEAAQRSGEASDEAGFVNGEDIVIDGGLIWGRRHSDVQKGGGTWSQLFD